MAALDCRPRWPFVRDGPGEERASPGPEPETSEPEKEAGRAPRRPGKPARTVKPGPGRYWLVEDGHHGARWPPVAVSERTRVIGRYSTLPAHDFSLAFDEA